MCRYQCRLLLQEPIAVNASQRVKGVLRMVVNDKFSYNLTLTSECWGTWPFFLDVLSSVLARLTGPGPLLDFV